MAKELHRLAGVPEGPCGIPELQQFQTALPGCQIKVMSIDPPHMIIYAGPTPSDKIIRLIKEGEHYDGCNSYSGFLSKSYFCDECNQQPWPELLGHKGNKPVKMTYFLSPPPPDAMLMSGIQVIFGRLNIAWGKGGQKKWFTKTTLPTFFKRWIQSLI